MIPHALSDTELPNQSAHIMRDSAQRLRVSWRQLCGAARVDPDVIDSPMGQIAGSAELRLQRSYAQATAGLSGSWLEMGLNYRLLTYGPLGIAMVSAKNVGEGLKTVLAHQELTFSLLRYRALMEGGVLCGVEADESALDPALREFSIVRDIGAVFRMLSDSLQAPFPLECLEVALPPPPDWERLAGLYNCPVQFGAASTRWRFKKGAHTLALPLADQRLHDRYARQCDLMTAAHAGREGIAATLSRAFDDYEGNLPSASEMAKLLGVSLRTLNRRLAEEHTSFGEVLACTREQRARHMLGHSRLSIEAISGYLGFSDAACFTRAFKRRTGMAPSAYRRLALSGKRH